MHYRMFTRIESARALFENNDVTMFLASLLIRSHPPNISAAGCSTGSCVTFEVSHPDCPVMVSGTLPHLSSRSIEFNPTEGGGLPHLCLQFRFGESPEV
ncbi:hypothetical protein NPIL_369531 [Nephila pilipes]|uniref:Uncharacterized protein n=1 Tax=Nephila pilipes TaxID=299642 RepID=A0A8X6R4D6_NEPPI|nr:hypothetical protein NPIL_369531 [Nephila pilipes]